MITSTKKPLVSSRLGPAQELHDRPVPAGVEPQIWVQQVSRPTLVMGSTQKIALIKTAEAARAGFDLCRRRSGGGLVVIEPDRSLWVDVILPVSHPLWQDDVGRAFLWVGHAWSKALAATGHSDLRVHEGPPTNAELGKILCFGSTGHGEVSVDHSKVVGLSQRRTRHAARFQAIAVMGFDHRRLAPLIRTDPSHFDALNIGVDFDRTQLRTAVVRCLTESLLDSAQRVEMP